MQTRALSAALYLLPDGCPEERVGEDRQEEAAHREHGPQDSIARLLGLPTDEREAEEAGRWEQRAGPQQGAHGDLGAWAPRQ